MNSQITIIVAYNAKGVIGTRDNQIPWNIKEDLNLFRETTMGNPVIMGRKTWDSIPQKFRPLPGRFNIVVTRGHRNFNFPEFSWDKMATVVDVETAISLGRQMGKGEVFITGGAQIYKYCLEHDLVDRVLASEIKGYLDIQTEGAAFFPNLKELGWVGTVIKDFDDFTLMEYRKKHDSNQNNSRTEGASEEACRTSHGEI